MTLLDVLEKTFTDDSFVDSSVETRLDVLVPREDSKAYKLAKQVLDDVYNVDPCKFPKQVFECENFKNNLAHLAIQLSLNSEQAKAFKYLCPDAKTITKNYSVFAPATPPKLRMTTSLALIFAFYPRMVSEIKSDIYKYSKLNSHD